MQIKYIITHHSKPTFASLALLISLFGSLSLFSTASAEVSYKVKSGDNLSKIIAKNYPDIAKKSYSTVMQRIVANNPDAFRNNRVNSLRVGKTLTLPDQDKLTEVEPTASTDSNAASLEASKAIDEKKQTTENADKTSETTAAKSDSASTKDTVDTQENDQQSTNDTATAKNSNDTNTPNIEDLQFEIDQLRALVEKYEAEKDNTSNVATADKSSSQNDAQQVETLTIEIEQLRTLVKKYESEQDSASKKTTTESNNSDNPAYEDLQAENAILQALVKKYEAENGDNTDTNSAASANKNTDKSTEDLLVEVEQLQALVKKYEAEQPATTTDTAEVNPTLTQLKQENQQLQEKVKKTQAQIAADSKTITQLKEKLDTTSTSTTSNQNATKIAHSSDSPIWLKFSWVLPLLAAMFGLYLLSLLIKRIRDRKATKELKIALSSSPTPSNTASAFSIDGSMLPTASTVADEPIEEDSVEAGIKIDMAKAYLDLNDSEAAQELLQEAIIEGSTAQRAVAEKLLKS